MRKKDSLIYTRNEVIEIMQEYSKYFIKKLDGTDKRGIINKNDSYINLMSFLPLTIMQTVRKDVYNLNKRLNNLID